MRAPRLLLLPASALAWAQDPSADGYQDLVALLNAPVVSASKTEEKLSEAPATVIVLTRTDLEKRGYAQLSEILDDLPGMEVIRPYGDTHLKNYWRGYRNTIGEPFLVMIDGVIFNHLYYNTADTPLVSTPLSNIDRVEVVYGPASSVYGANAFMGVINVITVKDQNEDGGAQRITMAGGNRGRRVVDGTYFFKRGAFRLSTTLRLDNGFVDSSTSGNYEFTKNKYFADRRMWGAFVDSPNLGGQFKSGWRNRALDMRAYLGDTEVGFQYLVLDTGYGVVYPGDLVQNNAVWARPDLSFHMRRSENLFENLTSTTLLRYRESGVRPDSYFVDGYYNGVSGNAGTDGYVAAFSYWQTINSSWSLYQDFDWRLGKRFSLTAGFKYERKDLQKAYDVAGEVGPYDPYTTSPLPGGSYVVTTWFANDLKRYPFPTQPQPTAAYRNRILTEDWGAFAQGKLRLAEGHQLNLGGRLDHNSEYGSSTTLRLGYVGNFGPWGVKALLGQAYQEPAPRVLYGKWGGSGSDPDLSPERSLTFEASATYTKPKISGSVSLWKVRNTDTIVTQKPGTDTGKGAKNLGKRDISGVDLQGQLRLARTWKLSAWYSHYFQTREEKFKFAAGAFQPLGSGEVGDLAKDKAWVGATFTPGDLVSLTLRGRYVGAREAVDTNVRNDLPGRPVTVVPSYVTLDLAVNATWGKLGLGLKVDNLLDKTYFHPGVRAANAGYVPGAFAPDNLTYSGGSGYQYYNSLLPQPGRSFLASLTIRY